LFAYGADTSGIFSDDFSMDTCDTGSQAAVWLQMSISAEILIFSARAPSYMWSSIMPSLPLFISVMLGCIVTSVMALSSSYFGGLQFTDVLLIWVYDIIILIIVDVCKVQFLDRIMGVVDDVIPDKAIKSAEIGSGMHANSQDVEIGVRSESTSAVDVLVNAHRLPGNKGRESQRQSIRLQASSARLDEWIGRNSMAASHSYRPSDLSHKSAMSGSSHGSRSLSMRYTDNPESGSPLGRLSENLTTAASSVNYEYGGRVNVLSGSTRPNFPPRALGKR